MVVDKGGLQYTISVDGSFASALQQFITATGKAQASWELFKNSLQQTAKQNLAIAASLDTITGSIEASSEAAASVVANQNKATRAVSSTSLAYDNYVKALERTAVAQRDAELAAEQGFKQQQRGLSAEQARLRAETDLQKVLDKRAVVEARLQVIQERSIELSTAEAQRLGVLTGLELERAQAVDRIAAAQAIANDQEIQQLEAQAIVLERVNAADQRRLVNEQLAADGRKSNGDKLEALTLEEQVKQRIAAADQRRAISEALLAQKRDSRGNVIEELTVEAEVKDIIAAADRRRAIAEELLTLKRAPNGEYLRELTVEDEIKEKIALADRKRLVAEGLAAQGRAANGNLLKEETIQFGLLGKNADSADLGINRVAFTFRRLFGILAAFAIAREALNIFQEFVKSSITVNAELESAQLGIAAVIIAAGKISDPLGNAVDKSRQLALAQQEAARQIKILRVEAQQTGSDLQNLVTAFQTAIAPGLRAGLNLDQIRELAVRISQAAQAIALPQNQLAEEIRSLLGGTIQPRTTRIATALGITNEDIKNAKELGTLADFLRQKFDAFRVAGQESLGTFNVIIANLKSSFAQLISAGGIEFFTVVKGLISDIQKSIAKVDPNTGFFKINPEAVAVVKAILGGLVSAANEARRLKDSLSFEAALNLAQLLGSTLTIAAQVLGAAVEGVVLGLNTAVNLGRLLAQGLNSVLQGSGLGGLFDVNSLQSAVRLTSQLLTVWVTTKLAVSAVGSILKVIPASIAVITAAATVLKDVFLVLDGAAASLDVLEALNPGVIAFIAGMTLAVGIINLLINGILLFNDRAGDAQNLFQKILLAASTVASGIQKLQIRIEQAKVFAQRAFQELLLSVQEGVVASIRAILPVIALIPIVGEGLAKTAEALNAGIDVDPTKKKIEEYTKSLEALKKKYSNVTEAQDLFEQGITNISSSDVLQGALDGVSNLISGLGKKLTAGLDLDPVKDQASSLVDELEKIPAAIATTAQELEQQGQVLRNLLDDVKAAKQQLNLTVASTGASGASVDQLRLISDTFIAADKDGRELLSQRKEIERQLADNLAAQVRTKQAIARLDADGVSKVDQVEKLTRSLLAANEDVASAKNKIRNIDLLTDSAQKDGNETLLESLKLQKAALEERAAAAAASADSLRAQITASVTGADAKVLPQAQKITDLVRDRIQLEGQEKATRGAITDVDKEILRLNELINRALEVRLQSSAIQQIEAERKLTGELNSRLRSEQALVESARELNDFTAQTSRARADLSAQQDLVAEKQREFDADKKALEIGLLTAQSFKTKLILMAQFAAVSHRQNLEIELENATTQQLVEAYNRLLLVEQRRFDSQAALRRGQQELLFSQQSASTITDEFAKQLLLQNAQVRSQQNVLAVDKETLSIHDRDLAVALLHSSSLNRALEVATALAHSYAEGSDDLNKQSTQIQTLKIGLSDLVRLEKVRSAERIAAAQSEFLTEIERLKTVRELNQNQLALSQTRADLSNEVVKLNQLRDQSKELQHQRELSLAGAHTQEENNLLADHFTKAQVELNLQLGTQAAKVGILAAKYQDLNDKVSKPIETGFRNAFLEFENTALDKYTKTLELAKQALDGFAETSAQTLIDALDPNKRKDIRALWGQFALDIGKTIVKNLIEAGVAKVLANIFGEANSPLANTEGAIALIGAGIFWDDTVIPGILLAAKALAAAGATIAAAGVAAGGATGGVIPDGHFSHFGANVQGLASGGVSRAGLGRPQGLDPRDTVPIWAQPGEFMMQLDSVRKYGLQVMQSINEGLIDPTSLKALAGVGRRANLRIVSSQGLASGGSVPSTSRSDRSSQDRPLEVTVKAVMVPDNATLETQLAKGTPALLNWLSDHANEAKSRLNLRHS